MTTNQYSQFGTFSVAIMLPIFIFVLAMLLTAGLKDTMEFIILGSVAITFLICLLIFYKLTIYINESYLSFTLGIGIIKRKYPISDIKSCRPVKNSPLVGIGIRMLHNGWLYNVSGLNAIELTFRNKKSIVRIGTNNPETISQIVNNLIKNDGYERISDDKDRSGYILFFIITFLVLFLPAILIISGNRETVVETANDKVTIKGIYGLSFKYSDILQLDSLSALPGIKRRTNGFEAGRTLKGNFLLSDGARVKMFIKKRSVPYIYIKTKDQIIYLNFENRDKTVIVYNQISSVLTNFR